VGSCRVVPNWPTRGSVWDFGHLSVGAVPGCGDFRCRWVVRRPIPRNTRFRHSGLLALLGRFHPNVAAVGVIMFAVYTVAFRGGLASLCSSPRRWQPVVPQPAVAITARMVFINGVGTTLSRLALLLAALAAGDALAVAMALVPSPADRTALQASRGGVPSLRDDACA